MRIGVLSDTHNNMKSVECIVEIFAKSRVERIVHTGDITQAKVLDALSELNAEIHGVYGNNDIGEKPGLEKAAERNGMSFHDGPLELEWAGRKIVVLEPRRLAARAAARRMAQLLGEKVGETVGYRMRLDTRVGPKTRIEVVTEGVFQRIITGDPELDGIGAILFDEFHERSLDADFGLPITENSTFPFSGIFSAAPISFRLDSIPPGFFDENRELCGNSQLS